MQQIMQLQSATVEVSESSWSAPEELKVRDLNRGYKYDPIIFQNDYWPAIS